MDSRRLPSPFHVEIQDILCAEQEVHPDFPLTRPPRMKMRRPMILRIEPEIESPDCECVYPPHIRLPAGEVDALSKLIMVRPYDNRVL